MKDVNKLTAKSAIYQVLSSLGREAKCLLDALCLALRGVEATVNVFIGDWGLPNKVLVGLVTLEQGYKTRGVGVTAMASLKVIRRRDSSHRVTFDNFVLLEVVPIRAERLLSSRGARGTGELEVFDDGSEVGGLDLLSANLHQVKAGRMLQINHLKLSLAHAGVLRCLLSNQKDGLAKVIEDLLVVLMELPRWSNRDGDSSSDIPTKTEVEKLSDGEGFEVLMRRRDMDLLDLAGDAQSLQPTIREIVDLESRDDTAFKDESTGLRDGRVDRIEDVAVQSMT